MITQRSSISIKGSILPYGSIFTSLNSLKKYSPSPLCWLKAELSLAKGLHSLDGWIPLVVGQICVGEVESLLWASSKHMLHIWLLILWEYSNLWSWSICLCKLFVIVFSLKSRYKAVGRVLRCFIKYSKDIPRFSKVLYFLAQPEPSSTILNSSFILVNTKKEFWYVWMPLLE